MEITCIFGLTTVALIFDSILTNYFDLINFVVQKVDWNCKYTISVAKTSVIKSNIYKIKIQIHSYHGNTFIDNFNPTLNF